MPTKMDFQELSRTPQEMQYAEGKKTNRDEILAAYGVGLKILGRTESQTRANAEAAIRAQPQNVRADVRVQIDLDEKTLATDLVNLLKPFFEALRKVTVEMIGSEGTRSVRRRGRTLVGRVPRHRTANGAVNLWPTPVSHYLGFPRGR
jgi:hypothetical protein